MWSLLLLGAAALAVSVAQDPAQRRARPSALLAVGVLLVGVFVVVDRRRRASGVAAQRVSARAAEVDLPHAWAC